MLQDLSYALKCLDFKFYYFIIFNKFFYTKNANWFKKLMIKICEYFLTILLIIFEIFIIFTVWAICVFLVSWALIASINLFNPLEQFWEYMIAFISAAVSIIVLFIGNALKFKNKTFKEKKQNYTKLTKFLHSQIKRFKNKEPIEDIPKLAKTQILSSNVVLKFLTEIKQQSTEIKEIRDVQAIIYKTAFLIYCMRREVSFKNLNYFIGFSFYELRTLSDGDLSKEMFEQELAEEALKKQHKQTEKVLKKQKNIAKKALKKENKQAIKNAKQQNKEIKAKQRQKEKEITVAARSGRKIDPQLTQAEISEVEKDLNENVDKPDEPKI